jgi:hypothetical protein
MRDIEAPTTTWARACGPLSRFHMERTEWITVPPYAQPGQDFVVDLDGTKMVVRMPDNAVPGDILEIRVPALPHSPPTGLPAVSTGMARMNQPLLDERQQSNGNINANTENTITQSTNVMVNTRHNVFIINREETDIMDQVTPMFSWCCGYCALTPSVASVASCTVLCCNCLCGCCREASEGCICGEIKNLVTCSGCALCMCSGGLCCFQGACAIPCQRDIPCRLTILYCTLGPGCGCCKGVNHAAVVSGIGRGRSGAPSTVEMER